MSMTKWIGAGRPYKKLVLSRQVALDGRGTCSPGVTVTKGIDKEILFNDFMD